MKTIGPVVVVITAALAAASCGHRGVVMAPLTRIPKPIESLNVGQRGSRVFLDWTSPGVYIDGRPLPSDARWEIWLMRNNAAEAELSRDDLVMDFEKKAGRISVLDVTGRPIGEATETPPRPLAAGPVSSFHWERTMTPDDGKTVRLIFGVRVVAGKRGVSDFVATAWWPRKLPMPPGGLRSAVFFDRIEVRWTPPVTDTEGTKIPAVKGYNVYRSSNGETPVLLNSAPVPMPYFFDRVFEFGKKYFYRVLALTGETAPYIESDASEILEVVPVDTYPPAPPKKLTSVTAVGLITLIWDAGPEADIAGYRVWRRMDDQTEFQLLTPEAITPNTFTDTKVESGNSYKYVVTAVDKAGNESARSEILTEIIKDVTP